MNLYEEPEIEVVAFTQDEEILTNVSTGGGGAGGSDLDDDFFLD